MAQEYDKIFKLSLMAFINAFMIVMGYEPGIYDIKYPEVFTQEGIEA